MAYEQDDRPMHTGNWTCAHCGGAITELPFEPDPSRLGQLKCRECHKKMRETRDAAGGGGEQRERKMVQGNWTCAGCGGAITELPFEPDPNRSSDLKCRECFRNR